MELPGYSTVLGVVFRIINNFIPSKKAALVDELNQLVVDYKTALDNKEDTKAATILKQMKTIRKKLGITGVDDL